MLKNRSNPPLVMDTVENQSRGILVLMLPGFGPKKDPEEMGDAHKQKGLILSPQVARGEVIKVFLEWLQKAGFEVKEAERFFSIGIWTIPASVNYRGAQTPLVCAKYSQETIERLKNKTPKVIFCLSCYLVDALNDETLLASLESVLGRRETRPYRLTETKSRVLLQKWHRSWVVGLPIPGKMTTPSVVEEIVKGLQREVIPYLRQNFS